MIHNKKYQKVSKNIKNIKTERQFFQPTCNKKVKKNGAW